MEAEAEAETEVRHREVDREAEDMEEDHPMGMDPEDLEAEGTEEVRIDRLAQVRPEEGTEEAEGQEEVADGQDQVVAEDQVVVVVAAMAEEASP